MAVVKSTCIRRLARFFFLASALLLTGNTASHDLVVRMEDDCCPAEYYDFLIEVAVAAGRQCIDLLDELGQRRQLRSSSAASSTEEEEDAAAFLTEEQDLLLRPPEARELPACIPSICAQDPLICILLHGQVCRVRRLSSSQNLTDVSEYTTPATACRAGNRRIDTAGLIREKADANGIPDFNSCNRCQWKYYI